MSMDIYPDCGYGLVFTADQIQPLLERILAVRYTNNPNGVRPENIHEALDDLNEYSQDWFIIDNNSDSNFNAVITKIDRLLPENLNNGLLYIPYSVARTPWQNSDKTKYKYIEDIKTMVGDILPDGYSIEKNFVFAKWCQFT